MNILQISFHTAPFGIVGKFDSGGLNIYVQHISKNLSNKNKVTVVTAEKADSFNIGNLQFHSLNLFEPGLYVEDKEIYLQDFKTSLTSSLTGTSVDKETMLPFF